MGRTDPGQEGRKDEAGADVREAARIARNTVFLSIGQVALSMLSLGLTAMLARYLGAQDYGVFYLATTLVQSAFVLVDLGQEYHVVRAVASDRRRVPTLLGTSVLLRLLGGLAAYPVMAAVSLALGYPPSTRVVVSLTVLFFLVSSIGDGINLVFRGLERMGAEAFLRVSFKALVAAAAVMALLAGGGLTAVLRAQIIAAVLGLALYAVALRRLAITGIRVDAGMAVSLVAGGAPFLLWNIVTTAQPSVDVIMLSALASDAAVGWYGAARRLVGLILFPATLLGTALYPTLGRLHAGGSDRYTELVRSILRPMVLLGTAAAAGTYLFADDAVALVYGRDAFGPTAGVLKLFAPYIGLVFVDIALGAAMMAANAHRSLIAAKIVSLLLAAGLNGVLIPTFDTAFGNGGLGSAAATSAAEIVMFIAALRLVPLPRSVLALALGKDLGRAVGAAAAMGSAAWLLRDAPPPVGIAFGLLAFVLGSVVLGGIRRQDVAFVRTAIRFR